jgi:hypothetical protein
MKYIFQTKANQKRKTKVRINSRYGIFLTLTFLYKLGCQNKTLKK